MEGRHGEWEEEEEVCRRKMKRSKEWSTTKETEEAAEDSKSLQYNY